MSGSDAITREGLDWALREGRKLFGKVADADLVLQSSMAAMIEWSASRYAVDPGDQWKPGEPLKLLFAGYAGSRNTGADVRVEEMIRQVRFLLGDDLADLSILTIDPECTRGYFRTVKQLHMPQIFPKYVADVVHRHHGVIACEGSMFKSKFANALSTLMVGAIGCASAEHKPAIGYGGEAGAMDEGLQKLVARYCKHALIVCRNQASQDILEDLGVSTQPGTDTAWTYTPHPPEVGQQLLREAGWDGKKPVVALCPINAFWWPVKPDVRKLLAKTLTGAWSAAHYKSVYFHRSGSDVDEAQERYIEAIAQGVKTFRESHDVFPICVGMEMLDRGACERLSTKLGGAPVFVSDALDPPTMVSLIRCADVLLSSRYHAIVCSMGGAVPSAGITMDERIHNLMIDRGTPELALTVDDPELATKIPVALERLVSDRAEVERGIQRCVVENLKRMGQMGQLLVDHLSDHYPGLPIRDGLGASGDPWDHLPPLSPELEQWITTYGGRG